MAEGEGAFGYKDPALDFKLDNDGDDDLIKFPSDTTQPLRPYEASTPYHGGEKMEMQTSQHEQSGLPSYDERVPLLGPEADKEISRRLGQLRENAMTGLIDTSKIPNARENPLSEEEKQEQIKRVKRLIKSRYPNANVDKLVISYSKKNPMDLVVRGPRGGETKIVLADGSDLQQSFISKTFIKKELGPPSRSIVQKEGDYIRKRKEELKDLRDSDNFLRGKKEDVENVKERLNKERAKLEQLMLSPDNEAEIERRQQLIQNLKKDLKIKEEEVKELEKKNEKPSKNSRKDRSA